MSSLRYELGFRGVVWGLCCFVLCGLGQLLCLLVFGVVNLAVVVVGVLVWVLRPVCVHLCMIHCNIIIIASLFALGYYFICLRCVECVMLRGVFGVEFL